MDQSLQENPPTVPRWAYFLLIGAVLAAFFPLLPADFTNWDDPHTVSQNPLLNPVRLDTFVFYWTNPEARIYIPLTYTVWSLLTFVARVSADDQGITLNATWYHLANLGFHAGSAVAVLLILRRLTESATASLIGALVFAIHPIQTESVAWISGLKDVLAGFFSCLAVLALVKWRQTTNDGNRWHWLFMLLGCLLLALLSKPSAISLPAVIAAVDLLALRSRLRSVAKLFGLLLLLALPFALYARIVQNPSVIDTVAIWYRPLIAMDSVAFYVGKIAWPAELTIDYGRTPEWVVTSNWVYITPFFTLLICLAIAFAWYRGQRILACSGAVLILAPFHVLGLARFDFQFASTTADHYLYFAMLGPAMAAAWVVRRYAWTKYLAVVVLLAYAGKSFTQSFVWYNGESLMQHALRVNPASLSAMNNLSLERARHGHIEEARAHWRAAVANNPNAIHAMVNLGRLELMEGDIDESRALFRSYLQANERLFSASEDSMSNAYVLLISTCLAMNRGDEAAYWLQQASEVMPADARIERLAARVRMVNHAGQPLR